jgi:hypothetical protein
MGNQSRNVVNGKYLPDTRTVGRNPSAVVVVVAVVFETVAFRPAVGVGVDLRVFPARPPPHPGQVVARRFPRKRVLHAPADFVDAVKRQRADRAEGDR